MYNMDWSETGWQLLIILWTMLVIAFAFGIRWLIYPKQTQKKKQKES